MATIGTVLQRVDALRPNAFARKDKTRWVSELDARVALEVLGQEEVSDLLPPVDDQTELLIPFPYDECYSLYLISMIEYANKEFQAYNNSMVMFNSAFSDFKKWHLRNNMPASGRFRNVMG